MRCEAPYVTESDEVGMVEVVTVLIVDMVLVVVAVGERAAAEVEVEVVCSNSSQWQQ